MTVAQPPRAGRRGRPGYDLESLLQVAAKLFNERGYDGTSMEDLSRKLGITKSAIYHHVPSKQELLRLAVNRALDGLFDVARHVESMPGPAIERLEALVRGSVGVLTDRLPFVTLLLRVHGNTKVERDALARRREFDRFAAELVKQAEAEGDIRPDIDPAMTARLLFGLINSLIEWYRPGRGTNADDLADAVCKITFDGMRVRPTRSDREH
ncbi:TetR/AcrR family transcriptional regulator [Phytoactinopolyspora mesophila]|uniref:TetR family transcriptional regulator n=1 Tax=Phytoactinopolyspora mesophila TaxID=2650750 RepID=A0A7K3ME40_9ACTN|nr:TetR/AcrR family transcriptional regulator [Phytoactinopolyspora mesophila]NDL60678.1 TetR family transcriptional regulator [Phytoactinopolyspora mesophila]